MSNTFNLLKQEEELFKDTLALNMFDLGLFKKITEDEDDYYYSYENLEKEIEEVSACVWLIYLKELISEKNYKLLFKSFLLKQKDFLLQPVLSKSENLDVDNFPLLSMEEGKDSPTDIPFLGSLYLYGTELKIASKFLINKDTVFLTLTDLEGEETILKLKKIQGARFYEEDYFKQTNDLPLIPLNKKHKDYGRLLSWWKLNSREKSFVLLRKEPYIKVEWDILNVEGYINDESIEHVNFVIENIYLKDNEINKIKVNAIFYKEEDESIKNDLKLKDIFLKKLIFKQPIKIEICYNNYTVKIKS